MHIAIVGNIGAGKTTLTALLANHLGYEPKFELVDTNPYLEDFYNDMKRWSFNLQIYFLNSRFKQVMEIQNSRDHIIQDRTIYEDAYIFAENLHEMGLMASRDYQNYLSIFDSIMAFVKAPDLLIYLRASVPTLVDHIRRRGREYETGIRTDYLSKLNEKYEHWINQYTQGKLFILDKDHLDFTNRPDDMSYIIQRVEKEIFSLDKI
jgi:deoxyadenosine/deoxycytidine kinase